MPGSQGRANAVCCSRVHSGDVDGRDAGGRAKYFLAKAK